LLNTLIRVKHKIIIQRNEIIKSEKKKKTLRDRDLWQLRDNFKRVFSRISFRYIILIYIISFYFIGFAYYNNNNNNNNNIILPAYNIIYFTSRNWTDDVSADDTRLSPTYSYFVYYSYDEKCLFQPNLHNIYTGTTPSFARPKII